MSDIFGVVGETFGPLIGDSLSDYALLQPNRRAIGTILPNVVVEEVHHDEMAITLHPVEVGAPITDHAFMQPFTVEIRAGWSNSTAQTMGYCTEIYQQLQAQQQSAQPFSIVTGKRNYDNMLMRSLMVKTDVASEWALMVVALCQQIIITQSSQTSATSASTPTDPNSASYPTVASDQSGAAQPTTFPTVTSDQGQQNLSSAPSGTPTVESLTANQGV